MLFFAFSDTIQLTRRGLLEMADLSRYRGCYPLHTLAAPIPLAMH